MKTVRALTGSAVAAAMLATSVAPAMAQNGQGWRNPGYGQGYGRHHRRHKKDGISAGEAIGAIAVVGILAAVLSGASKKNRIGTEDAAIDLCAREGEARYRDARIQGIDDVQRTGQGYVVRGSIDGAGYRDRGSDAFTCTVRYGQIERFDIGGGTYRGY